VEVVLRLLGPLILALQDPAAFTRLAETAKGAIPKAS
jgi:hypothetical protein